MKTLEFVPAVASDAELLTQTAFSSKKFWGYEDAFFEIWKDDLTVTAAYISNNQVVKVLSDRLFIGFYAICQTTDSEVELDHLWLVPDQIRNGFGSIIFGHLLKTIPLPAKILTLVAEPFAIGFYEKMGGKPRGEIQSRIEGRKLMAYEFEINKMF